jgi:hypothetical protein
VTELVIRPPGLFDRGARLVEAAAERLERSTPQRDVCLADAVDRLSGKKGIAAQDRLVGRARAEEERRPNTLKARETRVSGPHHARVRAGDDELKRDEAFEVR